ncbi:hypothetical protein [Kutzneria sp. CA-103260]|uniref:hypothetical protein n=1 Tax=Kutzneria sp. CA-103260 TaxID=2802641 RepID=UPI001BA9C7EB|nr:hypothetical protein [Kutzneria sp. CA-103260]QUQ67000.1 Cupin domain protein [Kutzneria sp. CA-103260]
METVTEALELFDSPEPLSVLERDANLLLAPPHPSGLPVTPWHDQEPLAVVHFPREHVPQAFAAPRGVYENDHLRIEWQTMDDTRQPFYHRNCDVDELCFQIAGERTLMTERGVIEHRAGEFSRIPRGVAHDNYGRRESHLLFYSPAPMIEERQPTRLAQATFPPFEGWQAGPVNEAVTECMGTPGHDIAVFPVDEKRLLSNDSERLEVLTTTPGATGVTWQYRSPRMRLGSVWLPAADGRHYRRTLDADEIQYQISGRRIVVSQRGSVELRPGDLVRIPLGVAHTSIATEPTEHLVLLSDRALTQVAPTDRYAEGHK